MATYTDAKYPGVTFTLAAELDDQPVRGNAMASGDEEADRRTEDAILARLNDGDVWAWASVRVTAEYPVPNVDGLTFTGSDYLGACSYANEEEFTQAGGYFDDMKSEAYDDLRATMRRAVENAGPVAVALRELDDATGPRTTAADPVAALTQFMMTALEVALDATPGSDDDQAKLFGLAIDDVTTFNSDDMDAMRLTLTDGRVYIVHASASGSITIEPHTLADSER